MRRVLREPWLETGHPESQRTESSHLTLRGTPDKEHCFSLVFARQLLDQWRSEDSGAGERKTSGTEPSCDFWLPAQ